MLPSDSRLQVICTVAAVSIAFVFVRRASSSGLSFGFDFGPSEPLAAACAGVGGLVREDDEEDDAAAAAAGEADVDDEAAAAAEEAGLDDEAAAAAEDDGCLLEDGAADEVDDDFFVVDVVAANALAAHAKERRGEVGCDG